LGGKHEPPTHKSFYISLATSTVRAVLLAAAVVLGVVVITNAFPEGGESPVTAPPTGADNPSPSPSPSPPTSPSPQQSPRPPRNVTVQVLNGAGITGLAARTTNRLRALGWTAVTGGNAPPTSRSQVRYPAGQQPAATALASRLTGPVQLVPDSDQPTGTMLLVLGATFAGVRATPAPTTSAPHPTTTAPSTTTPAQQRDFDPRPC